MSDKEPDVFIIIMKFMFSVATYIAMSGFSVYCGVKILRALGVTP